MNDGNGNSNFNKVLGSSDILVIAFGAMIGWGWVVSVGDWIERGGVLGASLGWVAGGIVIFFVGLTYAELTPAMPKCGGEHVFSFRAMGPNGSFVCTWAIILGYVSVVCYEACALPTIISYIFPGFLKGYMYTVAGFKVYATWVGLAMAVAIFMTWINILGAKTAARLQTVLTAIIATAGIILIAVAAIKGDYANVQTHQFVGMGSGSALKSILSMAVITPFFFIGFDVIPQAAEEIDLEPRKIGRMLLLSIICAVIFYALICFGVGMLMSNTEIKASMSGTGLVTADAMAKAFNIKALSSVMILAGACGIITSWNSFLIGGSRAMWSMADACMIPKTFAKLHPKYKTPVNALLLIGTVSAIAPLAGRRMLVWIMNAGNMGCCLAYCMVAISFLILRKKEPDMPRPYKIRHGKLVGVMAVILSGAMIAMYIIPNSGATLSIQEWGMAGGWFVLGIIFYVGMKHKYGASFAHHANAVMDAVKESMDDDDDLSINEMMF
ncbi:APC family permease [Clostridiales Family XIII bacterium RF-744-FAT-WT-3]|uniref:APC family permease n=1 Tax=Baileyella intestinalis TaxID=2606709 RepID=A0A6A8M8N4_9FIRM|nr:APC family permease [Baileyella intestinalis]MST69321.1 APC family permease [Baileyella intestinalis]